MTIKEVCTKFGITQDTLRYYEKAGAIPAVKRNAAGIRDYSEEDVNWVHNAVCMRSAGVSVDKIRSYVELFRQGDETIEDRCSLLKEAREEILEARRRYDEELERLEYKISRYEEAMRTGVLTWEEESKGSAQTSHGGKAIRPIIG